MLMMTTKKLEGGGWGEGEVNLKRKSGLDGMIEGCERNGSLKEEIGETTFHLNLIDIERIDLPIY